MPTTLPSRPRNRRAATAKRSAATLILNTFMLLSVLILTAMVLVQEEFYFSAPAHSLSETEAMIRTSVMTPPTTLTPPAD